MAYLVYIKITDERHEFTHLKTNVKFSNNREETGFFSMEDLEIVTAKMKLVQKTIDLIRTEKYDWINDVIDKEQFPFDVNEMIHGFPQVDEKLGKVKEFSPIGFQFLNMDGKRFIRISGNIIREKDYNQFHILVEASLENDNIRSLNYVY